MDPFASRDLFKLKDVNAEPAKVWHGFQLKPSLRSDALHLAESGEVVLSRLEPDILRLSIEDEPLNDHHLPGDLSAAPELREDATSDKDSSHYSDVDVWDAASLSCKQMKHGLLSWDQFNNRRTDPQLRYLSEAGEAAFNAVISRTWQREHHSDLRYARLDLFTQAALNILVGRSSHLFRWNISTGLFEPRFDDVALPGHSTELTATLSETLCACGSRFRIIQTFCKAKESTDATTFALQSSLLQILNAMEADLQSRKTTQLTIIGLVDISSKYIEILEILHPVVEIAQSSGDETYVLATVIEYITKVWVSKNAWRSMLTNLADRILQPAIRETQEQIDLISASGTIRNDSWVLAVLLPDDHLMVQEIVKCLLVGKQNGVQMHSSESDVTPIQLAHRWSDILEVQRVADILEDRFCNKPAKSTFDREYLAEQCKSPNGFVPSDQNPFEINLEMRSNHLTRLQQHRVGDIVLSDLVLTRLKVEDAEDEPELSPMQMLSVSLKPILNAQHRICSYALLRSVFLEHNVVAQLDLLYRYQLLGNGPFAARLSRALFDADQYSAEGHRKTGLTAGLRLEDREVWPPASSELRLVLMELLSESPTANLDPNLLESISFAIRDLSEEDLELCRNVHSIHALDFLRLTYASPNHVLDLIITPSILDKYDRVFKFLLVLLRMHALTKNLITAIVYRNGTSELDKQRHRFCLELHHFVASFLDHTLNVAINTLWGKMFRFFEQVHETLRRDDYDQCMLIARSLSHLCKLHEDALDEILAALFLRKSQTKLHIATCDIFQIGLRFAQYDRTDLQGHTSTVQHQEFRQALKYWFSMVSQLVEKGASRDLQIFDHLLVKVDHSRYYEHALGAEIIIAR